MADADLKSAINKFINQSPLVSQAMCRLKEKRSIRLVIEGQNYELFRRKNQVFCELAPQPEALAADVEFSMSQSTLRDLISAPHQNLGELGVAVLKALVSGQVNLRVIGSVTRILTEGYLRIISDAGPDFARFIAKRGLKSVTSIMQRIRKLRS